jgi:multiple sugar transport system substrate-binding protein
MTQRSLSRRHFLQLSGATASALALAACVPAVPADTPAGDAETGGPATVSENAPLWVLQSNDFYQGYNDFIRQEIVNFANEKGWALEVADTAGFLGGSADIQKISAAVQSGDAPDLWMHTVSVPQMRQLDNVVAVTDLVNELIEMYGAIGPRMRKATEVEGEFYGIPFHGRSDGGWARQDVFEAAGVDIASLTTYEQLREACLAASDASAEMWGWGMTVNRGGDGGYLINRVLNGWGAYWTDETGTVVTIDSPEAIEAVEWLVDTYTNPEWEPMLPPGVLSWTDPTNNESYLGGKVAYTQNAGTVYANAVVSENPVAEVTVYDIPKGGPVLESFNGLGGQNWLKIRNGQNPDAADEMLRHFFTEEVQKGVFLAAPGYAVPAFENLWELEEITSNPIAMALKPVALDPSGWNGLGYPGPDTPQIGAVGNSNVHTDMVAAVLTGQATAAEAVAQAAERSRQIFDEFGVQPAA